jgi:intracellular septation protein
MASARCRLRKSTLKILLDLLPVVVFFSAFQLARSSPQAAQAWAVSILGPMSATQAASDVVPVIIATGCAVVATVIQVGWLLIRRARISPAVWLSAALIFVFGGLTVWLQNEWFIKWKPTLLYWAFALVLGAGRWIWKRNLLGALFSSEMQLPPVAWDRLLVAWSVFFLAVGALNLFVAYQFSTAAWVNFKFFGMLGLTFVYSISTGVYIARYIKEPADG